jgi:hypothetical protein
MSEENAKKLEKYFDQFRAHVRPKLNLIFGRNKFFNEIQGENSIDSYITRLRIRVSDCKFNDTDDMIRDRLLFGCKSGKLRERLINEGSSLTLDKAIQIAQSMENAKQQMMTIGHNIIRQMSTTFGTNRNRTTDGKKKNKSSVLDAEHFIQNINTVQQKGKM